MSVATPNREDEAVRLLAIRARLAAVSSSQWARAHDGISDMVEARAEMGELQRILRFDDAATPAEMDFVAAALDDVRLLLGLVDRAIKAHRQSAANQSAGEPEARPPNFAVETGILCGDGRFQTFLTLCHGLEKPATNERAAQRLRSLLGVSSRSELNNDQNAAARWRKLRDQYKAWKRGQ